MTTLTKFWLFIKDYKVISIIVVLLSILACSMPLILYGLTFKDFPSENSTDWASFGTYIGGIYGPIFTLLSVIVLVLTVIEINQSNNINNERLRASETISQIIELTNILNSSIDKNPLFHDRNHTFNWLGDAVKMHFKEQAPHQEDVIWKCSIRRFKDIEFLRDQVDIVKEIFIRIDDIETTELRNRAESIFKAMIPNDERFWLECFIRRFHKHLTPLIDEWKPFSVIPGSLSRLIEPPEDLDYL